jgi:hypothetical protein
MILAARTPGPGTFPERKDFQRGPGKVEVLWPILPPLVHQFGPAHFRYASNDSKYARSEDKHSLYPARVPPNVLPPENDLVLPARLLSRIAHRAPPASYR